MRKKKTGAGESMLSAFVRAIERDTKKKGEQAGQWLSQHIYSEKEKNQGTGKKANPATGVSEEAAEPWEGENRQGGQNTQADITQSAEWNTPISEMEGGFSFEENQAELDSIKTPAQLAQEAAVQAAREMGMAYRGSRYGARGGMGAGDTRTNEEKRRGVSISQANGTQQAYAQAQQQAR